jgi:hypothetical protein
MTSALSGTSSSSAKELGLSVHHARVENGMVLLDERGPANWREKFTPEALAKLDIMTPCHCVLGVIFGGYIKGLEALGVDSRSDYDEVYYGFCPDAERSNEALTEQWKEQLRAGRNDS